MLPATYSERKDVAGRGLIGSECGLRRGNRSTRVVLRLAHRDSPSKKGEFAASFSRAFGQRSIRRHRSIPSQTNATASAKTNMASSGKRNIHQ